MSVTTTSKPRISCDLLVLKPIDFVQKLDNSQWGEGYFRPKSLASYNGRQIVKNHDNATELRL